MKTLKKTLCLVLAVVMALGVLVLPASAAEAEKTDADAVAAFEILSKIGVLNGVDGDHTADYDADLTRAEVAAIVYRIMTGDTNSDPEKKDNSGIYAGAAEVYTDAADIPAWAKGYVGYLTNAGVFGGDENGNFNAEDPVTVTELVKVMLCCIGYGKGEGEFSGEDWDTQVLTTAGQANIFNSKYDVEDVAVDKAAVRSDVFKIVYNAAIETPRVTYFGGTYSNHKEDVARPSLNNNGDEVLNRPLISVTLHTAIAPKAGDPNGWGMPTTVSGGTSDMTWYYNNPRVRVPGEEKGVAAQTKVDTPIYDSDKNENAIYGLEDMCDVASLAKFVAADDGKLFKVYRNGVKLADKKIDLTDEDQLIGDYGTHTLIFKNTDATDKTTHPYVLVYVDTFLAEVTSAYTAADTDKGGHDLGNAAAGNVTVYKAGDATSDENVYTTIVDNTATKDDVGALYCVTGYWKSGKFVLAADPTVDGAKAQYAPNVLPNVDVTAVEKIKKDGADRYIGIVSGSNTYIYNCNLKNSNKVEEQLIDSALSVVLTDSRNTILSYTGLTAIDGLAIVKSAKVVKLTSTKWVVEVEAYDLAGKLMDETLTFGRTNSKGAAFTTETQAEALVSAYLKTGTLIHYTQSTADGAGPYLFIDFSTYTTGTDGVTANTNFEAEDDSGDFVQLNPGKSKFGTEAVTVGDAKFLVNGKTVFLVARYKIDTTTKVKNDYKFVGYDVYTDFRELPVLDVEDGSFITGGATETTEAITVQALTVAADGSVTAPGQTEFASYVVINGSTKQITGKTRETVDDYAFIYGISQTFGDHYVFNAFIDGEKTTLPVALNAGKNEVIANLNSLFTYENFANGVGYSDVLTSDNKIAAGDFEYANAVLKEKSSGNTFTVAKGCKVYTVAPNAGDCRLVNLNYLTIKDFKAKDIYYQTDEYGFVSLIYINLDSKVADPGPTEPTEPVPGAAVIHVKDETKNAIVLDPKYDKISADKNGTATFTFETAYNVSAIYVVIPGAKAELRVTSLSANNGKVWTVKVSGLKADSEYYLTITTEDPTSGGTVTPPAPATKEEQKGAFESFPAMGGHESDPENAPSHSNETMNILYKTLGIKVDFTNGANGIVTITIDKSKLLDPDNATEAKKLGQNGTASAKDDPAYVGIEFTDQKITDVYYNGEKVDGEFNDGINIYMSIGKFADGDGTITPATDKTVTISYTQDGVSYNWTIKLVFTDGAAE